MVRTFLLVFSLIMFLSANAFATNFRAYDHLDPHHIIPDEPLQKAVEYFDKNKSLLTNQKVMTVIDYSQHSGEKRFYVIDMISGEVEDLVVAHGKGSDSNHDGLATLFSNLPQSYATSLGFYITSTTYMGENGYSLRLDGMSATNSNARKRAIVIHPASYVSDNFPQQGRSWGCPALEPKHARRIIDKIKHGSLIYAWSK